MALTVLITNITMDWPSGTVVYARDLALELRRQGHRPIVYTWVLGSTGRELRAAGIEVVDNLWRLRTRPDVIHAHHRPLARAAMLRFPGTPVVAFCHNHADPWDAPIPEPQIRRYFGVSNLCLGRLLEVGAPPDATALSTNFVDLARFLPRPALPPRPERALVFSNYAAEATHLPAVEEACRRLGLRLDVAGRRAGSASEHPEELLARYDLVFAKAKAALEAMAVGTAVILCDFGGLGPMVTSADFERLRPLNFGFEALDDPLTPEGLLARIERYDPADAAAVRDLVRSGCGLEDAVRQLLDVYRRVIEEEARDPTGLADPARRRATRSRRARIGRHVEVIWFRISSAPAIHFYRAFGLEPRRIPTPLVFPYRFGRAVARRMLRVR